MYVNGGKRSLDFILSLAGLIGLSPIFLILAAWIKLDSPGPVLFKQKRCAANGKFFEILKFRTMRSDTPKDVPTHMLDNPDSFITRSGKFLRRTSLDELPQILNILKGDMAIIGPRPALWNQDDLMALRKANGSAALRPGLSGWAQIHGRDELPIEVKAAYDGEYASQVSFLMDLRCFFGTFRPVLKQEGVHEGKAEEHHSKSDR